MGWFYEVNVEGEITDSDLEDKIIKSGEVVVQGKNSTRDYEDYYLEHGEPYRYGSLSELMPETVGDSKDVNLIASFGDVNKDGGFITFTPTFANGRWWLEAEERRPKTNERSVM